MTLPDPVTLALIIARILERLGVRYCIGGSVASSVYGEIRTTFDVDVVADLGPDDVEVLVAAWSPTSMLSSKRSTVPFAIDRAST